MPLSKAWYSPGGERRAYRGIYIPDLMNKGYFFRFLLWQRRKMGLELQYLKSGNTRTATQSPGEGKTRAVYY